MTYTEAHFKSADPTAKNIRGMIFNKYAKEDKAWVVSDSQIHLFEIDEPYAKSVADVWWDSEGQTLPDELKSSLSDMDPNEFESIESYAVQEAGRNMVRI